MTAAESPTAPRCHNDFAQQKTSVWRAGKKTWLFGHVTCADHVLQRHWRCCSIFFWGFFTMTMASFIFKVMPMIPRYNIIYGTYAWQNCSLRLLCQNCKHSFCSGPWNCSCDSVTAASTKGFWQFWNDKLPFSWIPIGLLCFPFFFKWGLQSWGDLMGSQLLPTVSS